MAKRIPAQRLSATKFRIQVSDGNIRQGHIYLTEAYREDGFFPEDVIGASNRRDGLGNPVSVELTGFEMPISTDVPADSTPGSKRYFFRERGIIKRFFTANNVSPNSWLILEKLGSRLYRIEPEQLIGSSAGGEPNPPIEMSEGERKRRLVWHRRRERKLRKMKIEAVLAQRGRLECEVPGCGFDFFSVYGEIGKDYAHVHHLTPLESFDPKGGTTTLDDLAIVCANCHAMVHRGKQCRPLDTLRPKRSNSLAAVTH